MDAKEEVGVLVSQPVELSLFLQRCLCKEILELDTSWIQREQQVDSGQLAMS